MRKKKVTIPVSYARNAQGIAVKKCCASCAYKELTSGRKTRHCMIRDEKVKPCEYCSLWVMNTQLDAAGTAKGRIKRKEYLEYLTEQREAERYASQLTEEFKPKSITMIREEFKISYCSIYENI